MGPSLLLARVDLDDAIRRFRHARTATDLAFGEAARRDSLEVEGQAARLVLRALLAATACSPSLPSELADALTEYRRIATAPTADVLAIPVAVIAVRVLWQFDTVRVPLASDVEMLRAVNS